MTKHLEAAFLSPLEKPLITCTGCWGAITGLLMPGRNITVCSASYVRLWASAGGHYRRRGPHQTDPLGLTWHSLSYVWQQLMSVLFPQHRQTMQAGKAGSCSLFPHLSASLPRSGVNFEEGLLEVSVLATFPYNLHKEDQFCLAAKGYYTRKHWGRSTSGQWCYHRRRETSYPLFQFLPVFLPKSETNHMTKYFKMNSQLLCRSHNQYMLQLKEEWQVIIFSSDWNSCVVSFFTLMDSSMLFWCHAEVFYIFCKDILIKRWGTEKKEG